MAEFVKSVPVSEVPHCTSIEMQYISDRSKASIFQKVKGCNRPDFREIARFLCGPIMHPEKCESEAVLSLDEDILNRN